MKSYEEIANIIFKRRDQYFAKKKKKKRIFVVFFTSLLCCAFVLTSAFGLMKYDILNGFLDGEKSGQSSHNSSSFQTDNTPNNSSQNENDFVIDSIDKINFYSAKKILNDTSLFPFGTNLENPTSQNNVLLSNNYHKYPIDRDKVFTVTMVTYFTIKLNNPEGFLAKKLGGTGIVEVVVTENNMEDISQMITFKRGEKYYSCIINGENLDLDSKRMCRSFSSHKYIDGFNIIKNFDQKNYEFIVTYEGTRVLDFECVPFKSASSKYKPDDITFIEDNSVVIFTQQNFTIDQLEAFLKSNKLGDLV